MCIRNSVNVTVGAPAPGPEEESPSCFVSAIRFLLWSLIFLVISAALIYAFTGNTFFVFLQNELKLGAGIFPGGEDIQQGTEGQPSGEGDRSTEDGAAPTFTPAPPLDEDSPLAPTPAVIFPTAAPSATPWIYPAPSQSPPTEPAPTSGEGACPYIDGDIVWLEVRVEGVKPGCISIASWQRIGLVSYLNDAVQVSLGDNSMLLAPGQRGEFSEPLSILLAPGANQLQVGLYGAVEVWLVAR